MSVIGIQIDRIVVFLTQTFYQRCRTAHTDEFALPLRNANKKREPRAESREPRSKLIIQSLRSSKNPLQPGEIGNIEMTDRDMAAIRVRQYFTQRFHFVSTYYAVVIYNGFATKLFGAFFKYPKSARFESNPVCAPTD